MKFVYNSRYHPPVPVLEVRLGSPGERLSTGPLTAIVDTGADVSVFPLAIVQPLQSLSDDYRFIRSHWGERRQVWVYSLDIGIGDLVFPAIDIVGDDRGHEAILGRNVLNKLVLTLNGPKRLVEILSLEG